MDSILKRHNAAADWATVARRFQLRPAMIRARMQSNAGEFADLQAIAAPGSPLGRRTPDGAPEPSARRSKHGLSRGRDGPLTSQDDLMAIRRNRLCHARCLLGVVTLAGLVVAPPSATARPSAFKPAFVVSHAGSTFLALSLTGTGFGQPGGDSFVRVIGLAGGAIVSLRLPSTEPDVVVWSDEHVVVKAQPDLSGVRIGVETPSGKTSLVPADRYDFEMFDTSAVLGAHTAPNHLALDGQGRVWMNGEFHSGIAYFDPDANAVKAAFWPRLPVPAFRSISAGQHDRVGLWRRCHLGFEGPCLDTRGR